MASPLADFQGDAIYVDTNILVGLVDANSVYRNIGYARVKCGYGSFLVYSSPGVSCPSMCRGDRMAGVAVSQVFHTTGPVQA
jgi:hypothetical protein